MPNPCAKRQRWEHALLDHACFLSALGPCIELVENCWNLYSSCPKFCLQEATLSLPLWHSCWGPLQLQPGPVMEGYAVAARCPVKRASAEPSSLARSPRNPRRRAPGKRRCESYPYKSWKDWRETEKSGVFEEVTKGSPNSNHCCFCFQVCTLVGRLSTAPGSYLANKSLYLCPVQSLACPHLQNSEMLSSPCSWLVQDGSQWRLVHCHRMQRLWQRQRKGDASRSQMCCTRGAWESLRCVSRFFIILVSSIGIFTKDYGLRCLPLAFQTFQSLGCLGQVSPVDVVCGVQPERTNYFLQCLCAAAFRAEDARGWLKQFHTVPLSLLGYSAGVHWSACREWDRSWSLILQTNCKCVQTYRSHCMPLAIVE